MSASKINVCPTAKQTRNSKLLFPWTSVIARQWVLRPNPDYKFPGQQPPLKAVQIKAMDPMEVQQEWEMQVSFCVGPENFTHLHYMRGVWKGEEEDAFKNVEKAIQKYSDDTGHDFFYFLYLEEVDLYTGEDKHLNELSANTVIHVHVHDEE